MQETHRKTKRQYQKILHTTRCEHRNCSRQSQSKRHEDTHLPSGARIQLDSRGIFPLDTLCVRDRMRKTQGTWQWQLYRWGRHPASQEDRRESPVRALLNMPLHITYKDIYFLLSGCFLGGGMELFSISGVRHCSSVM